MDHSVQIVPVRRGSVRLGSWCALAGICVRACWGLPLAAERGESTPQAEAAVAGGPRFGIEASVHDFGRVREGDTVRHTFEFWNGGDSVLEIKEVKSSCGCAAVGAWPKETAVGETGAIPVEFHAVNYRGEISESLTILSNDSEHPVIVLRIEATVWQPLETVPSSARLEFDAGAMLAVSTTLRITNQQETPVTLAPPRSSHPALAAELRTCEPGRVFELEVRTVPPLGNGNVFGTITIDTSSSLMPAIKVPAFAMVRPEVSITPPRILLPAGPRTNAWTTIVTIRSSWTNALHLSNLRGSHPQLGTSLETREPGRTFLLRLNAPADLQLAPGASAEATLQSNHPRFPVLRVPLVQPAAPVP